MPFQQTIYSLHSSTYNGGTSNAELFDNFEQLTSAIQNQHSNYVSNKELAQEWLQNIQDTLFNATKGSYTFDLICDGDEVDADDPYNDKIFITIATLPI
jgi:hypothetical protein